MNSKVFFIIGLLFLLQIATAAKPKNIKDENINPLLKGLLLRVELFTMFMDEAIELGELFSSKSKPIMQHMLANPELYDIRNETLAEEAMTELAEAMKIARTKDINKEPKKLVRKLLGLVFYFTKIAAKFDVLTNSTTEPAPKDNNFKILQTDVDYHFKAFLNKFTKVLGSYVDALSEHEKKSEKKLIVWLKNFEVETNVKKQLDMLEELFEPIF